jgi:antitoxin CptB
MQNQLHDSSYRRLAWQCRRGMRELDELLSGFLAQGYAGLDMDGQAAFETMLAYPDAVLLELLMGRMTPADKDAASIVRAIRNAAAV